MVFYCIIQLDITILIVNAKILILKINSLINKYELLIYITYNTLLLI